MVAGANYLAVVICAGILFSLLTGLSCYVTPSPENEVHDVLRAEEVSAVVGRFVSVPVKVYREAFKATLKLGQCPLVMEEGNIKTCKDEFEGEEVYIAKGSTTVDVTKVQTSEDILTHFMGGFGVTVGLLGLVSATPKIKVAVTTETSQTTLNLMSSYEMNKGVITLYNPQPKHIEGNKALFLSELELGGNELLLVTLEFNTLKEKIEVELSVTFKILFISITAKLNFIHEKMQSDARCRIQFKSSWRKELDESHSRLEQCIPSVAQIESMYMKGPQELRAMNFDDERSHYTYHFASWKESPYGKQFNLALINHDLEFLTEQNTEIKAVIQRISRLNDQPCSSEIRNQMHQFNQTLTDMTNKLTVGLGTYHTLEPADRQKLRDIYGQDKAPQYYRRKLEKIIA